ENVKRELCILGVDSPTDALSDAYDSRADVIDGYCRAFKVAPRQVGVIYRGDGALAGLDLFGSEQMFAHAFPKLLRGSALQVLTAGECQEGALTNDHRFLAEALTASGHRFPAVGLGEEMRIDSDSVGGGVLEVDGAL